MKKVAISRSAPDPFLVRRFWFAPAERGLYQLKLSGAAQLWWLRKTSSTVIPRAVFARGICFFPAFVKKQIPRRGRDDKKSRL
jgi:hypothetical protein